jgi:hypothetical protein
MKKTKKRKKTPSKLYEIPDPSVLLAKTIFVPTHAPTSTDYREVLHCSAQISVKPVYRKTMRMLEDSI